jgi:hypothetical protein
VYFLSFIYLICTYLIVAGLLTQNWGQAALGAIVIGVIVILTKPEGDRIRQKQRQEEQAKKAALVSLTMNEIRAGRGPVGWPENPRFQRSDACPNCGLKRVLEINNLGRYHVKTIPHRNSGDTQVYSERLEAKCRNCGFHAVQHWKSWETDSYYWD